MSLIKEMKNGAKFAATRRQSASHASLNHRRQQIEKSCQKWLHNLGRSVGRAPPKIKLAEPAAQAAGGGSGSGSGSGFRNPSPSSFLTFPCRWDGNKRILPKRSDSSHGPVSVALSEREALRAVLVVFCARTLCVCIITNRVFLSFFISLI